MAIVRAGFGRVRGTDGDPRQIGVAQINSNLATFIRTIVILAVTAALISWRGEWEPLNKISSRFPALPGTVRRCDRTFLAVLLSSNQRGTGLRCRADR